MEITLSPPSIIENTSKEKRRLLFEQDDLRLISVENATAESVRLNETVTQSIIHFYFCLDGTATFEFGPHYVREIKKAWNYFFFNPDKDLPFTLKLN